jgi:hypothetical protein
VKTLNKLTDDLCALYWNLDVVVKQDESSTKSKMTQRGDAREMKSFYEK